MTEEHPAVDTLISLVDSLTGLLYTAATAEDRHVLPAAQCDAALALADRVEDALDRLPWTGRADPDGLFDGLSLVGALARMLGKGAIPPDGAAEALFSFVEQLSLQLDLRWLAGAASPASRRLLPSTVELIGELIASEASRPAEPSSWTEAICPPGSAGTLTLLLNDDESDETADAALGDLRRARVPYSVIDTDAAGHGRETLWLPGMTVPLRRLVRLSEEGPARPVLSWDEHVALLSAADEEMTYTTLAAAYLGSGLRDAGSLERIATLGRVAEALAEFAPPAR